MRLRAALAELAAELRVSQRRLDALATGDSAADVRSVFSCSYLGLTDQAARLFRLAGLHPGADLSVGAAATGDWACLLAARRRIVDYYLTPRGPLAEHLKGKLAG